MSPDRDTERERVDLRSWIGGSSREHGQLLAKSRQAISRSHMLLDKSIYWTTLHGKVTVIPPGTGHRPKLPNEQIGGHKREAESKEGLSQARQKKTINRQSLAPGIMWCLASGVLANCRDLKFLADVSARLEAELSRNPPEERQTTLHQLLEDARILQGHIAKEDGIYPLR
jgi:hypothetical protein